jgi:Na+/H+ antiporter NhaA
MTESEANGGRWSRRTAWARTIPTPLRLFVRTESGSAAVLLAATVLALLWVNIAPESYEGFWHTSLSIQAGDWTLSQDLRLWVNNGLMTFFFFVVGLEARREFDMGELRDRRRITLPLLAGVAGMVVPIGIYLVFNAGTPTANGWGAAMSTDTAFALGMITLVAARSAARLRTFLLTVTVVDDIVALAIIAIAYSSHISVPSLVMALVFFAVALIAHFSGVRRGFVYLVIGAVVWVSLLNAGIEPVVVGLAMGMLTYAYPAARGDLERATDLFRLFREQPTPELARSAQVGVARAISPNERLQQLYHPWTSYVIVPLFALSNAGLRIDGEFLARAVTSPVTLGILLGYVVGKPIGVLGVSWLATKVSRGRLRPPIGWAAVTGGGAVAGIGFTVSLLIATLAFTGDRLEEAKLGVLGAAVCAALLSWLVFRVTSMLPKRLKLRLLLGTSESIVDLSEPVGERDHVRGPQDAPVTVVEYGDFECPYCGLAEPVVRELLSDFGDVRYVWRHLPLTDVRPQAQLAAEAAEAAAAQGAFWPMHDLLLTRQDALSMDDLLRYGEELGLDVGKFADQVSRRAGAARIADDVDSADLSGVSGTPTFFVNGRRHHGAYDIETLSAAVRTARARAAVIKGR